MARPAHPLTLLLVASLGTACAQTHTPADASKAPVASYTGCVTALPQVPDTYLFATGDRCLLLTGTFEADKVVNHTAVFRGVLAAAKGRIPASLRVEATEGLKASCTRTCTLPPPGTRGLTHENAGQEGGTEGAAPKTPHP